MAYGRNSRRYLNGSCSEPNSSINQPEQLKHLAYGTDEEVLVVGATVLVVVVVVVVVVEVVVVVVGATVVVVVGATVVAGLVTAEDSDDELELQAAVTRPQVTNTAIFKVRRYGIIHAI